MPKQESHVPEKKREFSGEKDAEALISFLNHRPENVAQARVLEIGYLVSEVLKWAWKITDAEVKTPEAWAGSRIVKEMEKAQRKLNKRLSRYAAVQMVSAGRGGFFRVDLWPVEKKPIAKHKGDVTLGEFGAVNTILRLANTKAFWRVSQCSVCGTYYFRRFSHQRFCGEVCRLKAFRSSEEWKEYRRNKAREYYWLHKNTNVK